MNVEIPKEYPKSDYEKAQIATEEAFNALIKVAKEYGLDVAPTMGLMYLPTQEMTQNFKQACNTILLALTPHETHIGGSDGKDYWSGDDNAPV